MLDLVRLALKALELVHLSTFCDRNVADDEK